LSAHQPPLTLTLSPLRGARESVDATVLAANATSRMTLLPTRRRE
jgi:hypothetical protein